MYYPTDGFPRDRHRDQPKGYRELFNQKVDEQKKPLDPDHAKRVALIKEAVKTINREGSLAAEIIETTEGEHGYSIISLCSAGGFISAAAGIMNSDVPVEPPNDATVQKLADTIVERAAASQAAKRRSMAYLTAKP